MAYKKTWTRPYLTNTSNTSANRTNNAKVQTHNLVDNLLLSGVTQTTDSGQLDIESIVIPGGNATIDPTLGYMCFKIFDDVALKLTFKYVAMPGGPAGGISVYAEVGTGFNGIGGLNGTPIPLYFDNTYTGDAGIVMGEQPANTGDNITSYIYKSENTFWAMFDMDRTLSGGAGLLTPTLNIFISKSVNSSLIATNEYTSIFSTVYQFSSSGNLKFLTIPQSSSYTFSSSTANLENIKQNSPLWTNLQISNNFEIPVSKNFNPMFNNKIEVNYDLLTVPINMFNDSQEFKILSGGSEPRNFIVFKGDYRIPMKPTAGNDHLFAFIWD